MGIAFIVPGIHDARNIFPQELIKKTLKCIKEKKNKKLNDQNNFKKL